MRVGVTLLCVAQLCGLITGQREHKVNMKVYVIDLQLITQFSIDSGYFIAKDCYDRSLRDIKFYLKLL